MSQARTLAVKLLSQIQSGDRTLDQLLTQADEELQWLNRADRALVHAIIYGVLRWQARLDWVIDQFAARPGKKIDPLVRIILHTGIFQIQHLDRIPVSAAVNTSVELAKKNKRKWAAGFVNGVLRQVAKQGQNITWPDRHRNPAAYLSAYYAFPEWMVSRWLDRFGMTMTEKLCSRINTIPSITLRTNTLRVTRQDLVDGIQNEVKTLTNTIHSPVGISFSSLRRPFPQWPAFQKGWFQVQNEAAQCIAYLLSPNPGHHVWDACAGLGTKSAHLAQLMGNKGRILATDSIQTKLDALDAEMKRLGITIVETCQRDLSAPAKTMSVGKYDRILVDAPCTGLGVLQKNPDGKWRTNADDIQSNARRQMMLLDHVALYLKPQGLLVYAVCSFEPEENEDVIHAFLQKHPEFAIDQPRLEHVQKGARLLTPEGFLRTFPHQHQMDGFFAAAIKKR
ncbi:MAG: 16S rRNA (cytosine(967)-C(5))-methyltransferase RsmB [Desulfobacteraceae bacterium]|jgi:16S rRNA (cytosine967-C5)-methyltransferase